MTLLTLFSSWVFLPEIHAGEGPTSPVFLSAVEIADEAVGQLSS
jgi:hypothetical protein